MIVYALIFVLFLGAGLLAFRALAGGQAEKVSVALGRLEAYDTHSYRRAELSAPAGQRLLAPTFRRIGSASRFLTPHGRLRHLEERIERAGRPWGLDLNSLLALKLAGLVLGVLVLILLAGQRVLSTPLLVVVGAALVLIAYYLPDLIIRAWGNERRARLARALPDFIDLLTVSVEAGLGLDAAMARIADKMRDPMREEILITLHHMRVGQSREAALQEMARRVQVKDLDNFTMALLQGQRLGVSLGQILRVQSESIRDAQKARYEEQAQKMAVKLLFPLIVCIFPALFVVILGPAAIRIYTVLLDTLGG
ncbi:MAG: hypothetical protein Kow00129_14790 [Thermoleophilia bacterium]